jgi:hypothetical protein
MRVMEERQSDLKYTIFRRQDEDPFIAEEIRRIEEGRPSEFRLGDFNSLWFKIESVYQIYRRSEN